MCEEFYLELSWYSCSHVNDFEFNIENNGDSKGISEWTDLAKIVCDGIEAGPPARPIPDKSDQSKVLLGLDVPENSDSDSLRNELDKDEVKYNNKQLIFFKTRFRNIFLLFYLIFQYYNFQLFKCHHIPINFASIKWYFFSS